MARGKKKPIGPGERRRRAYRERDLNLKAMGFESYRAYLVSDLWRGIRARVLATQPDCFLCGKVSTQVHHHAYRRCDLDGRDIRRLVALCGGCHRRIEFRDRDGEKLNPAQARAKLLLLVANQQRGGR